jgi:hypothetical protein
MSCAYMDIQRLLVGGRWRGSERRLVDDGSRAIRQKMREVGSDKAQTSDVPTLQVV